MNGTPPSLPNDSEDVVWALQTAESLWKRGERVDAVVWVRRAAQAAGESDDTRRAAALAGYAADLSDWIGSNAVDGGAPAPRAPARGARKRKDGKSSLEALDAMLDAPLPGEVARAGATSDHSETFVLTATDVEIVTGHDDVEVVTGSDFEAGFGRPASPSVPRKASDASEVFTVPSQAPDVELLDDDEEDVASVDDVADVTDDDDVEAHDDARDVTEVDAFPEEERTPVVKHVKSPLPPVEAPTSAQAHAGMLDPWNDVTQAKAKPRAPSIPRFEEDDEEVVTSAGSHPRTAAQPPPKAGVNAAVPAAPRAPNFPSPKARAAAPVLPTPPPVNASPNADDDEDATTSYRQINPRVLSGRGVEPPAKPPRPSMEAPTRPPTPPAFQARSKAPPVPTETRPRAPSFPTFDPRTKATVPAGRLPAVPRPNPSTVAPPLPPRPNASMAPTLTSKSPTAKPWVSAPASPPSDPPGLELLELVDAAPPAPALPRIEGATISDSELPDRAIPAATISEPATTEPDLSLPPEATPSAPDAVATAVPAALPAVESAATALSTPAPKASLMPLSARPTAPPPDSQQAVEMPSGIPTRPHAGSTLLDLGAVEALADLPDEAREAFARSAKIQAISIEEEVSHFALALVVDGDIDVSATIVDAPALRLSRNDVLRSRGSMVPGVALRLVCNSQKATLAIWDEAAVADAFRTCPWVEDDLRAVTDRVQAKAGVTMGALGERFDMALREHLTSRLTFRTLSPNEVLVAEGKPVGILIVGIGDVALTKKTGERTSTARPGDFIFPMQTLSHAAAPETATAGAGGALVLVGDRMTAQELLMTFPPLLEVLATL